MSGYLTPMSAHLSMCINNTLVGRMFFYNNYIFQNVLYSQKEKYLEHFKLTDKYVGQFTWRANKRGMKDINIWNMDTSLIISARNGKTEYFENMSVKHPSFRVKDTVFSSQLYSVINQNKQFYDINTFPKEIYNLLSKQKTILKTEY